MKKILAPIDGSQNSLEALKSAKEMAEKFGSQLIIINVQKPASFDTSEPVDEDIPAMESRAQKILDKALEVVKGTSKEVRAEKVCCGDPAEQIIQFADDEDVDLIVMGSHGLSGVKKILLGSVSNNVTQQSSKPVFIVK